MKSIYIAGARFNYHKFIISLIIISPLIQGAEYKIVFGDLHTHTGYSDGTGTPAEAFAMAKNSGQADFLAVTDHQLGGTDWAIYDQYRLSPNEWTTMNNDAVQFTDSNFVAIAAIELTNNLGHINWFNGDIIEDNLIGTDLFSLTQYYSLLLAQPTAIGQWNHPQWRETNDFSDFDHYQSNLDSIISLIELSGGSTEVSYQKALDKGWHVSPTENSDTHSDNWIVGYETRTAVLVNELTKADIFDAIRNQRTYATQDRNLKLSFKINGQDMGSKLAGPTFLNVMISAEDPDISNTGDKITIIELIRENGEISHRLNRDDHKVDWSLSFSSQSPYYYVRLTQFDGDRIWSAPIWTIGGTPIGIPKIQNTLAINWKQQSEISVINLKGEVIQKLSGKSFQFEDLKKYSGGIYFLLINDSNEKKVYKIPIFDE